MSTVHGKYGYYATVLKHSISPAGIEHIVFEVGYWRGVLAELNTHKMLSKSSASSRAIPFAKMQEQLTGRPIRFGQANPGMQDKGEDFNGHVMVEGEPAHPGVAWECAKASAVAASKSFYDAGFAKQVFNRLTEPFQMMKTVLSGTEWNNFMWLRDHGAADPSIAELASVIKQARADSLPKLLNPGEWACPYVEDYRTAEGDFRYYIHDEAGEVIWLSLDDALKVSAARCAAVSFRNVDYGVEKSRQVAAKLIADDRKHASAFEHQATPMQPNSGWMFDETEEVNIPDDSFTWEPGVSHVDRDGQLWSGNLKGFVQNRKLIDGENIPG